MASISDLTKISKENYRKNGYFAHIIYFFLTLFACVFILLGVFYLELLFIIIPLVVIPCIFAANIVVMLMREQPYLSFGGFVRCFTLYFSNKFRSSYKVIFSFLWSLLVYVVLDTILLVIINLCFYYLDVNGYQAMYHDIVTQLFSNISSDEFMNVLNKYVSNFSHILVCTLSPSLLGTSFFFISLFNRNSISIYERLDNTSPFGRVSAILHSNVISHNRMKIFKENVCLNYPFYILLLIGMGVGGYLGYLINPSYDLVFLGGLILGLVLSFGLYGPVLIANNEAIYIFNKDKYSKEEDGFKDKLLELQKNLEKFIEEQNTKKDSDESH